MFTAEMASSFPPLPRARLNLFASVMEHPEPWAPGLDPWCTVSAQLAEDSVGNDGSAPPDVGHSGTFTVIQEIAGGVIVELEDGRQCVWRSSAEDEHGPSLAAPATPGVGLADRDALDAAQLAEFHAARNSCHPDWQARIDQLAELHAARNSCHPDWQARIDRINAEAQAYEPSPGHRRPTTAGTYPNKGLGPAPGTKVKCRMRSLHENC